MARDFRSWLRGRGYAENTIRQNVNRMERLRRTFGNIESIYDAGALGEVFGQLRYSTADEKAGRQNPTSIEIDGNLRTGLSVYASTLRLFETYLDSGFDVVASTKSKTGHLCGETDASDSALDARRLLLKAAEETSFDVKALIARTAMLTPLPLYRKLSAVGRQVRFPQWRAAHVGEISGRMYGGVYADDGHKADMAIRSLVLDKIDAPGFMALQIWPTTQFDPASYSHLANLVLLPTPVAELVIMLSELQLLLQARAEAVFGWRPAGETSSPSRVESERLSWLSLEASPIAQARVDRLSKVPL